MGDKVSITSGTAHCSASTAPWPGHGGTDTGTHLDTGVLSVPPTAPEVSGSVTSISCQNTPKHTCPVFRTSSLHLSLPFDQILHCLNVFPIVVLLPPKLCEQADPFVPCGVLRHSCPALQPCRNCSHGARGHPQLWAHSSWGSRALVPACRILADPASPLQHKS